jgi:hypothetical protein
MRLSIFITACGLFLGSVVACSLSKSNREPNPATSQSSNTHDRNASATPATTPAQSEQLNQTSAKSPEVTDELHTPEKDSDERQAIMDALRGNQQVVFQVNYLKVHNGWCWVDTTPLDKHGRATAEGGPNLLHLENGKWRVMDLSKVPDDPNDPLGPEDASPTYIKNLMKTFPGVPRDIFPKPTK